MGIMHIRNMGRTQHRWGGRQTEHSLAKGGGRSEPFLVFNAKSLVQKALAFRSRYQHIIIMKMVKRKRRIMHQVSRTTMGQSEKQNLYILNVNSYSATSQLQDLTRIFLPGKKGKQYLSCQSQMQNNTKPKKKKLIKNCSIIQMQWTSNQQICISFGLVWFFPYTLLTFYIRHMQGQKGRRT